MNYRRILVLTKVGGDSRATFAALRCYVPSAEHVTVLAQQPAHQFAWMTPPAPPDHSEGTIAALDTLRSSAHNAAPEIDIRLAPQTDCGRTHRHGRVNRSGSGGGRLACPRPHPARRRGEEAHEHRRSLRARGHGTIPSRRSTALRGSQHEGTLGSGRVPERPHRGERSGGPSVGNSAVHRRGARRSADVTGLTLEVEVVPGTAATLRRLLTDDSGLGAHLIVLPRFPPALLLPRRGGHPMLILPSLRATGAGVEVARAIDVPDLIDDGGAIRVRAEYAIGVGRRTPIADQELVFVRGGSMVACGFTRDGECELASGLGDSLGISRRPEAGSAERLTSIETHVHVLCPDARPRLLFDADLKPDELRMVRDATWAEPVGVRVRSTLSCRSLRARLRAAGVPPIVIDAGAVLDEGDGHDVSALVDAVRLARTAARLRAYGFQIAAIVYQGPHQPSTIGFAAVRPHELSSVVSAASDEPASGGSLTSQPGCDDGQRNDRRQSHRSRAGQPEGPQLAAPGHRDQSAPRALPGVHGARR